MMNPKMVLHVDGATLTIEGAHDASAAAAAGSSAATVAAPDWSRWAKLAACVITCMAAPTRETAAAIAAEKGGAHQTPPTKT